MSCFFFYILLVFIIGNSVWALDTLAVFPLINGYSIYIGTSRHGRREFFLDFASHDIIVSNCDTSTFHENTEIFYFGTKVFRLPVLCGDKDSLGLGHQSPLWIFFSKATHTPTALILGDDFYRDDGRGPVSFWLRATETCASENKLTTSILYTEKSFRACISMAQKKTLVPHSGHALDLTLYSSNNEPFCITIEDYKSHPYIEDIVIGRDILFYTVWYYNAYSRQFALQTSVHRWIPFSARNNFGIACIIIMILWVIWILISSEKSKSVFSFTNEMVMIHFLTVIIEIIAHITFVFIIVYILIHDGWFLAGHMAEVNSLLVFVLPFGFFLYSFPLVVLRASDFYFATQSKPPLPSERFVVSFILLFSAWICIITMVDIWYRSFSALTFGLFTSISSIGFFMISIERESWYEVAFVSIFSLLAIFYAIIIMIKPYIVFWWIHTPGPFFSALLVVFLLGIVPTAYHEGSKMNQKIHNSIKKL